MNKLWSRMALSYVLVFLIAITMAISLTVVMDALNYIDFENFNNIRTEEIPSEIASNFIERYPRGLAPILIFTSTIGIIAGALVSRQVAKPISEMAEAAGRIGEKDFDIHLEEKGMEETRILAAAINQMVTQLREAEEIRQNLLADVSHELRTPLTVLEGQLRGALDNVMELDGENLANLYNQTRHLIKLVNELYELAQAEARMLSMEFVSTEISPLVKEVYDIFRPLAEEQEVSLNLDIAKGLPEISIDTYRIRQSLHNLLANSLRYTPPGGSINLRVAKEEENVVIEIMDTGKGIEPEHLNKIFDRLYRIDKSRNKDPGGTGLGLAIVKAIIEAHNGLVTAQSEGLGEGSTFTITFPIA